MGRERWLWPLLGFFGVWIGGISMIAAQLVVAALAALAGPTSAAAVVIFSIVFLVVDVTALYLVLFAARVHREEVEVAFDPELDHDELRLRWRPARPNVLRLLWTGGIFAMPIVAAVDVAGTLPARWTLGAGLYGAALLAVCLAGLLVAARFIYDELAAFDRYRLDVRGGEMALTVEGPLRSRRRVWPLGTTQVRARHEGLVIDDGGRPRTIRLPTSREALEQLAAWIQAAGRHEGGGLPTPPPALARLRGRQSVKARRR